MEAPTPRPSPSSERAEALHREFQDSLRRLVTSEDWQHALAIAARLHKYSFANTQLIWAQAIAMGFSPTQVAGFTSWRELGRHVRRGEKGIAVLAPVIKTVDLEDTKNIDVKEGRDERRVVGFRPVHVFDISQTDGPDLPDSTPAILEGDLPEAWDRVAAVIEEAGYSLDVEGDPGLLGGANGITDMERHEVVIKGELSGAQRFKTAVHELAHIRLHQPDNNGRPHCRGIVEVEAESVAFMICSTLGLDSASYSLPYVAGWSGGDLDKVASTANRVLTCASQLIDQLTISRQAARDTVTYERITAGSRKQQVWEPAIEPPVPDGKDAELGEVLTAAIDFYQHQLRGRMGGRARDYLSNQGFSPDSADRWQLGYAPPSWNALATTLHEQGYDPRLLVAAGLAGHSERGQAYDLMRGRIIFPVLDPIGRPRGLAGRLLVGEGPKYLNSPGTAVYLKSQLLYGMNQARDAIAAEGKAIIVEGYTDVLAAHQEGFSNTVAACGTALTREHLRELSTIASSAVLAFDGDHAGQSAFVRLAQLPEHGVNLRVAKLPEGKDPADLLLSESPTLFAALVSSATPLSWHLIDHLLEQFDPKGPEGKARTVWKASSIIGAIANPDIRASAVAYLARRIEVELELVATSIDRYSTRSAELRGSELSSQLGR